MAILHLILFWLGIAALALGLLFALQGGGIVRWPPESFMVSDTPWIWRGAGVMLAGIAAIIVARRS